MLLCKGGRVIEGKERGVERTAAACLSFLLPSRLALSVTEFHRIHPHTGSCGLSPPVGYTPSLEEKNNFHLTAYRVAYRLSITPSRPNLVLKQQVPPVPLYVSLESMCNVRLYPGPPAGYSVSLSYSLTMVTPCDSVYKKDGTLPPYQANGYESKPIVFRKTNEPV